MYRVYMVNFGYYLQEGFANMADAIAAGKKADLNIELNLLRVNILKTLTKS